MEHPTKVKEKLAIRMLKNGRSVKNVCEVTGLSFYWVKLKADQQGGEK